MSKLIIAVVVLCTMLFACQFIKKGVAQERIMFTISYDTSGNIVDIRAAEGFEKKVDGVPFPFEIEIKQPTKITAHRPNATFIQRSSLSPDCTTIVDMVTGKLTKIC